jgi:hypothetical protein
MKDFLGRELKVGQRIVYPGRGGSSLWMNQGHITGIGDNYIEVLRIQTTWDPKPTGETKKVRIYCYDRTTIVD